LDTYFKSERDLTLILYYIIISIKLIIPPYYPSLVPDWARTGNENGNKKIPRHYLKSNPNFDSIKVIEFFPPPLEGEKFMAFGSRILPHGG